MGGVSVLLMFAAVGITYGWQPDNQGGVEYVIQIEPDQLNALDRIGEISSVIDPAVRGHVSRVVIKVGTGPVPKIMPPNLARANSRAKGDVMVVADHAPIPIPEMEAVAHAIPIPSLDERGDNGERSTAVMKPDANDSHSGPGFAFPSLPSSLREGSGAGDPRAAVDTGNRAIVPPPATRNPNIRSEAPQFTGSDPNGQMARARPGGPTTAPTNSRDNLWQNLTANNEFVGPRSGGPSTDPIGRNNASIAAQPTSTNPAVNRGGVSGLSAGDTFGRMPGGIQTREAQPQQRNLYTSNENLLNANPANRVADPNSVYSQYEQTQLDRQSQYTRAAAEAAQARLQLDARGGIQAANGGTFQGNTQLQGNTQQGQSSPDARLTAAQVAAGAWSVDIYGRPVDRNGRLLPINAPSQNVVDSSRDQFDRYADRTFSSLGRPNVNSPAPGSSGDPNTQTSPGYPGMPPSQAIPNSNGQVWATNDPNQSFVREKSNSGGFTPPSQLAPRTTVVQREPDPPSLSNRPISTQSSGAAAPRVTTQPLLNGLLLISFVANVYLIFWMKNLRMQFRDLVAAKRIANSNSPVT